MNNTRITLSTKDDVKTLAAHMRSKVEGKAAKRAIGPVAKVIWLFDVTFTHAVEAYVLACAAEIGVMVVKVEAHY